MTCSTSRVSIVRYSKMRSGELQSAPEHSTKKQVLATLTTLTTIRKECKAWPRLSRGAIVNYLSTKGHVHRRLSLSHKMEDWSPLTAKKSTLWGSSTSSLTLERRRRLRTLSSQSCITQERSAVCLRSNTVTGSTSSWSKRPF